MSILVLFVALHAGATSCWRALDPVDARARRVTPALAEWLQQPHESVRRVKVRFARATFGSRMQRVFHEAGAAGARLVVTSERRAYLGVECTQAAALRLLERSEVVRIEEDLRWEPNYTPDLGRDQN